LAVTEDSLRELIRDPRYWRDRDPEIVQRVTAGYRKAQFALAMRDRFC
jgi:hypothetical protein